GQQADEDPLQHLVLARDHALDLEERALDQILVGAAHCSQSMSFHCLLLRGLGLVAPRLPAEAKRRLNTSCESPKNARPERMPKPATAPKASVAGRLGRR